MNDLKRKWLSTTVAQLVLGAGIAAGGAITLANVSYAATATPKANPTAVTRADAARVELAGSHKKAENACNPCAAKCNPCAAKNACNPCAAKACNPCAAKACNPCAAKCNPCAAKNPCGACNPCAAKNPCGAENPGGVDASGNADEVSTLPVAKSRAA